jgi:hypothetical protein
MYFKKKKFVVHKTELKKPYLLIVKNSIPINCNVG